MSILDWRCNCCDSSAAIFAASSAAKARRASAMALALPAASPAACLSWSVLSIWSALSCSSSGSCLFYLRELFAKCLRLGGIELVWSIARGFLQGVPQIIGLGFDLLEFLLRARQRIVRIIPRIAGIFACAAPSLAHLIEFFAQLAGLFIEALGFLCEAALAFRPLAHAWINRLFENDDAHGWRLRPSAP